MNEIFSPARAADPRETNLLSASLSDIIEHTERCRFLTYS